MTYKRIFMLERINTRLGELRERHQDDKTFFREAARMMQVADPASYEFLQKHIPEMNLAVEE